MRFLCLHGRGTNSDIFESQLVAFLSRISGDHSFDFIDAPFESPPSPGISRLYPGPYLAWHSQYETKHVQSVHDFLWSIIREDGPYDGVIGFSQGAALAASLLLCHEFSSEMPGHGGSGDPPFKIAIFFNSVMLFSPSESIGSNISEEIRMLEKRHTKFLQGISTSRLENEDDESETSERCSSSGDESDTEPAYSIFGFSPKNFPTRISIPSIHIVGRKDEFADHSRALVKLCQPDKAEVLIIDGGHELPRTAAGLDKCAELFELVVTMASLGGA